jgi:hypothetical protein
LYRSPQRHIKVNNRYLLLGFKNELKHFFSFVDVYEETFSSMLFIQLSVSVVVICISCLQLSMVQNDIVKFTLNLLYRFR